MHTPARPEPEADAGFVMNSRGDLVASVPRGSQMLAGCGFMRDGEGNMLPDGTSPTAGFFRMVNGELIPRIT